MPQKPDTDRLADMAARAAQPVPDFTGTERAERDGRAPRLPQPCPVTPLGKNGSRIYFLDRSQQIIEASTRCEKGDLMLFFGDDWLCEHFAQVKVNKKGETYTVDDEWDQKRAQVALVEDCHAQGIFNPAGRVFGRGAHRVPGDHDQIILHLGNRVMRINWLNAAQQRQSDPDVLRAGRLEGPEGRQLFFPAAESLPAPAIHAATEAEAMALLELFGEWHFKTPQSSTLLLLGMVMQMYLCGALDWRAHMWLSGPTATGKSTLQKLIRDLLQDWCLHTEDASEAAIRQELGDDTLPVMIDEAEAHDKPERLAQIINLMKKASSGAKIYRGSQDHKAQQFTAQSCFLFSSVIPPPFRGEDRNRLAILDMLPLATDKADLDIDRSYWQKLGRRFHRRMVDQWPRFEATFAAYRKEIGSKGYSGRWRDTYGTLLACADLALFDHPVTINTAGGPKSDAASVEPGPVRVARLVSIVAPTIALARSETRDDVERGLIYLASLTLPGSGGRPPEPIALWIERAMDWKRISGQFETDPIEQTTDEDARAKLKAHGLRLVEIDDVPDGKGGLRQRVVDARPTQWDSAFLAVAYATNKPLCDLFKGSDWADGAWITSLNKVPGAIKWGDKVRFSARANSDRALLVPLKAFVSGED